MDDLTEYFSDKKRIVELESKLEAMTIKYNNALALKSKYKVICERLSGDKIQSRGDKALKLISELKSTDKPTNLIRAVAKKCFLSEHHVRDLWYK